ncbi:MAG: oxygen-independent coproporphyrinogen oxidase [Bacteroidetes bacterium]|nr:oxygen-independent coproporphyrinogen oxidase [Bacteroidota bacterium]
MAGIYIHIPYCKTKCSYCDFFSGTNFGQQSELLDTMKAEIILQKDYLGGAAVSTIYFGGGTPSTLSVSQIQEIMNSVRENFRIEEGCEITLEANPEDLNLTYLEELKKSGINRLSMGIQSFDNEQLKFIRRRHTAETAVDAVKDAQTAGFDNISIDLIYGLPNQSLQSWKCQIDKALTLNVQHISAYGLTYEMGTLLWKQLQKGEVIQVDDETMNAMYAYLAEACTGNGFEQYEISNFAVPGYRSRHNSAYWKQQPYLGIGPSAHSYNMESRQWNVSSISKYCNLIVTGKCWYEKELLSEQDKYNDFVMVSLRTVEGIDLKKAKAIFGKKRTEYCLKSAEKYIEKKLLYINNESLRLTHAGILISDQIITELIMCGD